ncbi:MAG: hypothetical protein LC122_03415 [Chitinophagales bacterium]|nr:hypothetical protein [Chitinophagales bacterium]
MEKKTRQELTEAKRQKEEYTAYKKRLKETIELLEMEYKELFYRLEIPKLKQEFYEAVERYKKSQEEVKDDMEKRLNESAQEEPKNLKLQRVKKNM